MLSIDLPSAHYPILFSEDIWKELSKHFPAEKQIAIITDTTVAEVYSEQLQELLRNRENIHLLSFEGGEQNKNLSTIATLTDQLQKLKYGRKNTLIIALGGGIVGDIAGFVASIYLRGVPFVQIPTTLLSMVDSSIGGKTGVNTNYGKNMLGAFYQPQKVLIAPEFLRTLPETEISNGLAEMIKHAVLDSSEHLQELQSAIASIFLHDHEICKNMIIKSIQVKTRHVEADEKEEKGIRAFLNFGHTIGHAIEKASQHKIPHGQAVAIGMEMESKIAEEKFGFPGRAEILSVLKAAKLPSALPAEMTYSDIAPFLDQDKKNEGRSVVYVLPKDFGEMMLYRE